MKRNWRAKILSVAVTIVCLTMVGVGFSTSVYDMADGIVRPSHETGAEEAFLPIIAPISAAANLLALPNGDLLCFYFTGTKEGDPGVSTVLSRLDRGSDKWTKPMILFYRKGYSNQDPAPFRATDGKLWLFIPSVKANKGQTTTQVYYLTSDDEGHKWTTAKLLFNQPGSFVRQPATLFHSKWLLPEYHSAAFGIMGNARNDYSMVRISTDEGKNWNECRVPGSSGIVQMNIIGLSQQHLLAFFRSRYADWIYKSFSNDGCHWSVPVPTQLPNNNASIQATRLKDGHLVIAFNNAQATTIRGAPRTAPRTILSVALSADGGKTWPWVRDVQAGLTPPEFVPAEDPEYAYPSITQSPNGMIQLAFHFRRETIKYMTFDEQWIKDGHTIGSFKGDR